MGFIRNFNYRNTWVEALHGTDKFLMPYDFNEYPSMPESYHDRPEKWLRHWRVFYLGENDYNADVFDNPKEVFCINQSYYLYSNTKIVYSNGRYYTGVKINGIDGIYDTKCFTTLTHKEQVDVESTGNLLVDIPKDIPKFGTPEYRILFKETCGSIASCPGEDIEVQIDSFAYVQYIIETRKPEEYPKWLSEMLNAPSKAKPKKKK